MVFIFQGAGVWKIWKKGFHMIGLVSISPGFNESGRSFACFDRHIPILCNVGDILLLMSLLSRNTWVGMGSAEARVCVL